MFAMTTDSVGIIIPEIVKTFRLSLTAAGTFQYATMAGSPLQVSAGSPCRPLRAEEHDRDRADPLCRSIVSCSSRDSFLFFCVLMALSGIAIAIFKTGALALIGDISRSTAEHTSIMKRSKASSELVPSWAPCCSRSC
jgi:fucose permease